MMKRRKILLIQLRQLGDILLTTPCIRAIRQSNPNAHITFLSHTMGRLILENNPDLDATLYYEDSWTLWQHLNFLQQLKKENFDLVIDFMNNPRSALFTLATRAPERISFFSIRRFAYTKTIRKPAVQQYIVERKQILLSASGIAAGSLADLGLPMHQASGVSLVLPWHEKDLSPTVRLLDQIGSDHLRIVISPTHRREKRRWPLRSYAALADQLVRSWQANVIWLWGPGEEELIDSVRALCLENTIKAPKTTFRELSALIANSHFFIGNSNGPSHVAVAAGVPSLQLHGPTDAIAWTPAQKRHQFVQAKSHFSEQEPQIADLALEEVSQACEALRAEVLAFQDWLRQRGIRRSWLV